MVSSSFSPKDFPVLDTVLRLDKSIWQHDGTNKKKAAATQSPDSYAYVNAVQFYPYTAPGVDPVFAFVQWNRVVVCRPKLGSIEIIAEFIDDDEDHSLFKLAWSQDLDTGDALLLVAGNNPKIKVLNVTKGIFVRSLLGHGKEVTALEVSPTNPEILASCSSDRSIRIWSLNPKHAANPTCAVLYGMRAMNDALLAIHWHFNGRFIASAGHDTIFNVWVIPEYPKEKGEGDHVDEIHYPHFSSTEMHTQLVDHIRYYGDLIFTTEALGSGVNSIVLWRLEDFDSKNGIPPRDKAPIPPPASTLETAVTFTRSWDGGRFQRILTLDLPESPYWGRCFEIFSCPEKRPMLAVGNHGPSATLFFWDLQTLEEEQVDNTFPQQSALADRNKAIHAHMMIHLHGEKKKMKAGKGTRSILHDDRFEFRQASWSPGGEWCVFVSLHGYVVTTRRWLTDDTEDE